MTEIEQCWYHYDAAFRDWVDVWKPKIRDNVLTRAKSRSGKKLSRWNRL